MPAFIVGLLLLAGVIVGSGNFPLGGALIPQTPSPTPLGAVCIDPTTLGSAPVILTAIPKATQDNTPFPNSTLGGYDCSGRTGINECQNQPDTSDYVLAAGNAKVERVWPHARTTRLYKQYLPSTFPDYDKYKDRVYRASCNDWCGLGLPYGGTYHCDFIWLYKDDRFQTLHDTVRNLDELYPDDRGCDLKKTKDQDPNNNIDNCPTFDVLIRKADPWPIPDEINCQKVTPTPLSKNPDLFSAIVKKVFAQAETFIDLAGHRWIFSQNPKRVDGRYTLIKNDLRTPDPPASPDNFESGREKVADGVVFRGGSFEAYKNLTNKIGLNDDYLYLVEPGKVTTADDPATPAIFQFDYLEFRKSPEVKPKGKTLQLGTFEIPVGEGWWKEWIKESKPAIYLYPEKPMKLRVKLNPAGKLLVSDPPYNPERGWEVIAYPGGTIRIYSPIVSADLFTPGESWLSLPLQPATPGVKDIIYPYLFYEADINKVYVEKKGFVVAYNDLVKFFKVQLPKWGLNTSETQDFIDYWMSRFDKNKPYYFIHFLGREQIEKLEPLEIYRLDPVGEETLTHPQTAIRIRTYLKPLDSSEELGAIAPQTPPTILPRTGFSLVEWGGFLDE